MRWPKMLDYPKWNWIWHLRQRSKQAVFALNSCKFIHPRPRLSIEVWISCQFFLRVSSTSGIVDWDMQVWKLSESFYFTENFMTATSVSRKTQSIQGLNKDILLSTTSTTSRESSRRFHESFDRNLLERKMMSLLQWGDVKRTCKEKVLLYQGPWGSSMASFCLRRKNKFTVFAEKKNYPTQVLWNLRLQDLRILATHFKNSEKECLL
jgi:hypothetical protein